MRAPNVLAVGSDSSVELANLIMYGQNLEVWEAYKNLEGDELVEHVKERKQKM